MKSGNEPAIYSKIALDLAVRIASGVLREGTRVMGRSTLAGEYQVSPETIRRALSLLEEQEILEVLPGSGVVIRSQKNAEQYLTKAQDQKTILDLRKNLDGYVRQKEALDKAIWQDLNDIIDYCDRLKNSNPIFPVEFEIPDRSSVLGRQIGEIRFWQQTGATIVGLKRNGAMIISPGPFATFQPGDVILAVGDASTTQRVREFLRSTL